MMVESPSTLQVLIVEYVASNIDKVCVHHSEKQGDVLRFRDNNAFCHHKLSNLLLQTLDRRGSLDDLTLSLFKPAVLRLSHVSIQNGSELSSLGLHALRGHQLTAVEICRLDKVSLSELISCFSEWTIDNLSCLGVSGISFRSSLEGLLNGNLQRELTEHVRDVRFTDIPKKYSLLAKGLQHENKLGLDRVANASSQLTKLNLFSHNMYVALCKLKSLHMLNVSNTEIVAYMLTSVCNELKQLSSLDISSCLKLESVDCLRLRKDTLKQLNMYNTKVLHMEETKVALLELRNLQQLDVSENKQQQDPLKSILSKSSIVPDLLRNPNFAPHLQALDISGQEEVKLDDLHYFVKKHPKLSFLGLMLTTHCLHTVYIDGCNLKVTGIASPEQLAEALRQYRLRKDYIPKILYKIFMLTSSGEFSVLRSDMIKLILPVMDEHPKDIAVQLAGTACLYNLTHGKGNDGVHPHVLRSVVSTTLTAMNNFPEHAQLQKNALLTLCCDRILHDVTFNKFQCAKLVLDCLLKFNDNSTDRMAVAICSILAAKISASQTNLLGSTNEYMHKLLSLVKRRMDERSIDITLKFTLSALWNLTDESPDTCHAFLLENGLNLFLLLLETFPQQDAVETKVLGLLNNIAEVPPLRSALIKDDVIARLRQLLKSESVDVSYFAAGIVAHLVSNNEDSWEDCKLSRSSLLAELGEAVLGWQQPKEEMVAYRSFQPFIPLLMSEDKYQVQLWALWALHHVTSKNSKRYCTMLISEGVDKSLKMIVSSPTSNIHVQVLASKVLSVLHENGLSKEGTV